MVHRETIYNSMHSTDFLPRTHLYPYSQFIWLDFQPVVPEVELVSLALGNQWVSAPAPELETYLICHRIVLGEVA